MSTAAVAPHKLVPPRPAIPPRPRLVRLLDGASGNLTVVAAGAGFGKSTCVSAWADTIELPVAWLNLDRGDNDAVRLVRGIVASLEVALGDIGLDEIGHRVRLGTVTRALDEVERRLVETGPFVLVLDDVHEITEATAADVLDSVVDMIPTGSRVVLSGRTIPSIHTARRQVAGELAMVGPTDLRFDDDESWDVLDEFAEHVGRDVLASIIDRLEGWPAGIQFTVLGLRAQLTTGRTVTDPAATTADVADYFQQEFLRGIPDQDRAFLTRTSVLDRLSPDLCDRVLDRADSGERLTALIASGNAFVSPVSDTDNDIHYHPLFADLLLDELRATEPDLEGVLRARAIAWHEQRGEGPAAIEIALNGRGCVPVSPLIFVNLVPTISSGEIASIGRWLEHLGPDRAREDPVLAIAAAWHALFTNRRSDMERWLSIAQRLGYDGRLPDGTNDLSTAVAAVRMFAGVGGVRAMADDAKAVIDAGVAGGPWRPIAVLKYADSIYQSDRTADAIELYEEAEFETRGVPAPHAVALAHLAVASLGRHDAARATRLARQALAEVREHGLTQLPHVSFAFCASALVDAYAGATIESERAARHASTLLDSVDAVHTSSHAHHHLILADAALLRHDPAAAAVHLGEVRRRLSDLPDAVVLADWARRLDRRCADSGRAGLDTELTPAEVRVLEQLATHRTLAEIGERLYVSRNTVKTHTVAIYRKLRVSGRSEAIDRAIELGLVEADDRSVAAFG